MQSELTEIQQEINIWTNWNHTEETKSEFNARIQHQIIQTLSILETIQPSSDQESALKFFLKAKLLNLDEETYNPQVEDLLKSAVQSDKSLMVDVWLELGESSWKKGDLVRARNCFENIVKTEPNHVAAMKKLSVAIRYGISDPTQKLKNTLRAIDLCKACLAVDMKDGEAWYYLGNAQLGYYFASGGAAGVQELKKCLIAYETSENNSSGNFVSDLYTNRAQVLRYLCKYNEALDNLDKVLQLEPDNIYAEQTKVEIISIIQNTAANISCQCDLDPNELTKMIMPLIDVPFASSISMLEEGSSEDTVCGVIVGTIENSTQVPLMFIIADVGENFYGLSVYDITSEALKVGDILTIKKSIFVDFTNEFLDISYQYLIVEPKNLLKNGHPLNPSHLTSTVVDVSQ